MINEVPIKINEAARAVTLKHPNSMDCVIYRKVNKRTNANGEQMGGMPTLGGLGVLSSEDEPDFEYQELGAAKILITTRYEGMLDLNDSGDALAPDVVTQEAQIEAIGPVPAFTPKKNDLVAAMPGGGVVIGFEIVGTTGNVAIYPYTTKFIIAPRDELHDLEPWRA